jgi:hypothetical protein
MIIAKIPFTGLQTRRRSASPISGRTHSVGYDGCDKISDIINAVMDPDDTVGRFLFLVMVSMERGLTGAQHF